MSKKKNSKKTYEQVVAEILDIKAILTAISDIEQSSYPTNALIDMARKKLSKVFYNVAK